MQREVRLGVNFILGHQCLQYGHHSFEEQKKLFLGPIRPHLSGYFWSRNFFFPDSEISTSARIRMQIEFARPRVSDTYLDSLEFSGLLQEYWQQSMGRGRLLEYSIHGKKTELHLVTSLDKKKCPDCPDIASTWFRIHSVFKLFHSGERIQKVTNSYAGFTRYVWTRP